MTTPTTTDLLKYVDLQMAAEAFLVDATGAFVPNLPKALTDGNELVSRFTQTQAKEFLKHWRVVTQMPNTKTGFSGTVFECRVDDPLTGAKARERVLSLRSTEFVDDHLRDNQATNTLEIFATGFAWGQLRDLEDWYAQLVRDGELVPGTFGLTGYSLGGHLATAFNEMHPGAVRQVVTFNGAGIGGHDPNKPLLGLVTQFADLAKANQDGSSKFSFNHPGLTQIYSRVRDSAKAGQRVADADHSALQQLVVDLSIDGMDVQSRQQAERVLQAVGNLRSIQNQLDYLGTVSRPRGPAAVALNELAAFDLDYQMAVLSVGQHTDSAGLLGGIQRLFKGKQYGIEQANQFDVVGDTWPSAVAESVKFTAAYAAANAGSYVHAA
jgi:hypothetical protein